MSIPQRIIILLGSLALCIAFVVEPYNVTRERQDRTVHTRWREGEYTHSTEESKPYPLASWVEYHTLLSPPMSRNRVFQNRWTAYTLYSYKAYNIFYSTIGVILVGTLGFFFLFKPRKQ